MLLLSILLLYLGNTRASVTQNKLKNIQYNLVTHSNDSIIIEQFTEGNRTVKTQLHHLSLKNKHSLSKVIGKDGTTITMLDQHILQLLGNAVVTCISPTTLKVIDDIVSRSEAEIMVIIYHISIIDRKTIVAWQQQLTHAQKIIFQISEDSRFNKESEEILKGISRMDEEKFVVLFTPLEISKFLLRLKNTKFLSIQKDTWIVDENIYPESFRTQRFIMFGFIKYDIQLPAHRTSIEYPVHNRCTELENEKLM